MEPGQTASTDDQIIQPMCAIFRRYLKRQGLKFTQERAMILDAVLDKPGVFEADELLQEMREAGHRVSKATIYRTLKHLREANIINEVLIDPRQAHYELSFGREPKGHLVCVETNQIIEFSTRDLVELREKIAREHGFEPLSHRFIIYGVSPEAQQSESEGETQGGQKGDEQGGG
jgi:Fur family ferric uptake transcriptional regulator